MPLKKEHKENRRKKEEEYYRMWIDFKPIYNTLESQAIFVKGLRPQYIPDWGSLQHLPDPPSEPNLLCLG